MVVTIKCRVYCRLNPWPTFYTSDIDGLCDRSGFFSFFVLFITQFLHPGFHYQLSQPEFPSLQLMRSPTQDYKKPQNITRTFFISLLCSVPVGYRCMWASRRQRGKKKKRLLERIPRVCCYVCGVNKHLSPCVGRDAKSLEQQSRLSRQPDCLREGWARDLELR